MEVSSKHLFPNFVFLDAPFNLKYYKQGNYRTQNATMGCRTRVFSSVFPNSDGIATRRGICSFTTINLPRLGIKHGIVLGNKLKLNWKSFYTDLDKINNLVVDQLLKDMNFKLLVRLKTSHS